MLSLVTLLERLPGFRSLRDGAEPGSRQRAAGLAGSARSVLAASLFYRTRRTVLVVTAGTRQAENYVDDLHALIRTETDDLAPPVRLFPSLPTLLYDEVGVDRQLVGQRLEVMEALLRGEPQVVVAPLSAILHRTVPPAEMRGSELSLQVGDRLDPAGLIEHLEQLGYRRHEPVLVPGECSLRGGIVDVYPMTAPQPVRIELWGDEIESIRLFDVNSQRSTLPQQRFVITVSRETVRHRAVDASVMADISSACEQQAGKLERAGRG
ncbi:MAG: transcription-repair coupling factor, partial [Armatimonadetes bacterium]|nr:transcription-repair coupling factor [Armatimonadota bacterium]